LSEEFQLFQSKFLKKYKVTCLQAKEVFNQESKENDYQSKYENTNPSNYVSLFPGFPLRSRIANIRPERHHSIQRYPSLRGAYREGRLGQGGNQALPWY
jgi:hypothetical protein